MPFLVCSPGGYLEYQGYDISAAQALIPKLQRLLHSFRSAGFPVYHTREGSYLTCSLVFYVHSLTLTY